MKTILVILETNSDILYLYLDKIRHTPSNRALCLRKLPPISLKQDLIEEKKLFFDKYGYVHYLSYTILVSYVAFGGTVLC